MEKAGEKVSEGAEDKTKEAGAEQPRRKLKKRPRNELFHNSIVFNNLRGTS